MVFPCVVLVLTGLDLFGGLSDLAGGESTQKDE